MNNYDGNWCDELGVCKVCGGEIPHGHTNNCDILKLEQKINQARSETAGWLAQLKVFKQQCADQTELLKNHKESIARLLQCIEMGSENEQEHIEFARKVYDSN